MNETATADFLGTTLTSWYEDVARWEPRRAVGRSTCSACQESLLARAVDVDRWPHELIHPLVNSIGLVITHVRRSLDEESLFDDRDTLHANAVRARELVTGLLERNRDDIHDVLEQCVGSHRL